MNEVKKKKIIQWNIQYWYPDIQMSVPAETKEADQTCSSYSVRNLKVSKFKARVAVSDQNQSMNSLFPLSWKNWLTAAGYQNFEALRAATSPVSSKSINSCSRRRWHASPAVRWDLFPSDSWFLMWNSPQSIEIKMSWDLSRSNWTKLIVTLCFGEFKLIPWSGLGADINMFANAWKQSYLFWNVKGVQIDSVWMETRQEIRRSIVILGIRIERLWAPH